jgi:exodeoxyribonuclease VII large subunit
LNTEAITVKELTKEIKRCIESHPRLQDVWVRGEISNFTHHSRGHMYLSLKDEEARIKAVMFAGHNRYLKFIPKNGLKVLVRGEVSLYERDGQYQFYIKEMQPDGIGALYQAYEDLKIKLEQKGWFSPEAKKPIPVFPQKIGIITSPTGAAIRDILITLKRRFPIIEVVVFPVLVQGEFAPKSLSKAIQLAHEEQGIDVLIMGRGGGSIEELWAFNEETVAEAIFNASIPIISAVGHETDFTIADFVADLRAPTPTAAAELSVPQLHELRDRTIQLGQRLNRSLLCHTKDKRKSLEQLRNRYAFRYPGQLIEQRNQQLDNLIVRLQKSTISMIGNQQMHLDQLDKQLGRLSPSENLIQSKIIHGKLMERLKRGISNQIEGKKKHLHFKVSNMDALSPLKIMTKGYSLVYNEDKKKLYKSARHIQPGQVVKVVMKDGELDCQVWGIKEEEK